MAPHPSASSVPRLVLIAAFLATFGPASHAHAGGALNWFGFDTRSAGMGGTGAAAGKGPGSLILNPALMSFSPGGIWLSYSVAPNWMSIDLAPRSGDYDISDSIYSSHPSGWGKDRPLPTALLTNQRSETDSGETTMLLSLAVIGSLFHEDLRLGLAFTTPLSGLMGVETWYNDEREQYFSNKLHLERFGEFDTVMSFTPGVSFAPADWISLGFSLQVDLALVMEARMFMTESTEWEYSYLNAGGEVVPMLRPIAGVAFKTPVGLDFGIVYRHESYADVQVDVDLRVWAAEGEIEGSDELQLQYEQSHRYVLGYKPKEIALAAGFTKGIFCAEVVGTVELWSDYLDRHGNYWNTPEFSPVEEGTQVSAKTPSFDNIVTLEVGAEAQVWEHLALRAGFAFHPSPMPEQTGRYNYVDNDLFMYSLGAGFSFQVLGKPVTADLAVQLWHMKELTVLKNNLSEADGGIADEVPDDLVDYEGNPIEGAAGLQTNNPGFPGYEVGGLAANFSLMLGVKFD